MVIGKKRRIWGLSGAISMEFGFNLGLLIAGAVVFLIGLLLRRFASRYDFSGMAMDSAIQFARGKRTTENPTDIEKRLNEINSASSTLGKARRVGGNVAGYFVAPILKIVALISLLGGLALMVAAYFLR